MNRNRHLESLRKKLLKVAPEGDLDSLARDRAQVRMPGTILEGLSRSRDAGKTLDSLGAVRGGRSTEAETSALRKLTNGELDDVSPREELHLEAIVEEEARPVSFIIGGRFEDLPAPWAHYNDIGGPIRQGIEDAIPMIGRVEVPSCFPGDEPKYLGTGFIVGRNLMMTNRHVAELFVRGVGTERSRLSFLPGALAAIDFEREKGFSPGDRSSSVAITGIVMVHPYWDMALFQVDELVSGTLGLPLSVCSPEDLEDREIAVIGYPGRSRDRSFTALELERKYFGNVFGVKRLAPGEIREREQIESFGHSVSAMTHDSSTLPGNSGAAILDVASGEIVGLHFAGITLKANYCVPTFELARDPRIIDAGLNFQGSVPATDEWAGYWKLANPENG